MHVRLVKSNSVEEVMKFLIVNIIIAALAIWSANAYPSTECDPCENISGGECCGAIYCPEPNTVDCFNPERCSNGACASVFCFAAPTCPGIPRCNTTANA